MNPSTDLCNKAANITLFELKTVPQGSVFLCQHSGRIVEESVDFIL